jgi:hypothetical protein
MLIEMLVKTFDTPIDKHEIAHDTVAQERSAIMT